MNHGLDVRQQILPKQMFQPGDDYLSIVLTTVFSGFIDFVKCTYESVQLTSLLIPTLGMSNVFV